MIEETIMELPWDIIGPIFAVLTFILGAIELYRKIKKSRRKLKLTFSDGTLIGTRDLDLHIFIDVANPGKRPIQINVPYLLLEDGRKIVFPNPNSNVSFPHKLHEGENCKVWIKKKELANSLKKQGFNGKIKFKAEVEGGTGNKYTSNEEYELNIDGWTY